MPQDLEGGDKSAISALLDANFTWTDGEGNARNKAETLENIAALATANQGDTDVESHYYGQLEMILGTHHNAQFARVWVKRPMGWQLFFLHGHACQLLRAPHRLPHPRRPGPLRRAMPTADNPCRTLPYTPTTKMDQEIIDAWKKTKVAEWHPNYEEWEPLTADEFYLRTSGGSVNKTQRAEQIKRGQAAGTVRRRPRRSPLCGWTTSGDNAAVMVAASVPPAGGKPSYTLRVWVFRDNRWQLALSQTSTSRAPASASEAR